MAGATSACPREHSVLQRNLTAAWLGPLTRLARRATRPALLRIALAVQFAALGASAFPAGGHLSLPLIGVGFLITALALRAGSRDRAASAAATPPEAEAASSPQNPAEPAAPAPLPFMGARLSLDAHALATPAFSDAVSRARQLTVMRRRGLGELMARVSHELRTPLNAVIGFSDVMSTELFGPVGHPRYREYAHHIRDSGRVLLKSAEDALAITSLIGSDGRQASRSALRLAGEAREAWSFFAADAAGRDVRLELRVPDGLELFSDRQTLRQILINLFSEALDRTADGGDITLAATTDGDLAQVEIIVEGAGAPREADEASLSVCLARALLELQGAPLIEINDPACAWRAVTVLDCAAQQDFFDLRADHGLCGALAHDARPAHVC